MLLPLEPTDVPGVYRRGSKFVVVYRADGRQHKQAHEFTLSWLDRYAGTGHDSVRISTRREYRRLLVTAVQEAVVALERPLGLGTARVEKDPADGEPAAEGGELLGRAAIPGVERALAVPDELLRQRPEPMKTAAHAPGDVAELLREDERAAKLRE
jgi:hypothetical protein